MTDPFYFRATFAGFIAMTVIAALALMRLVELERYRVIHQERLGAVISAPAKVVTRLTRVRS